MGKKRDNLNAWEMSVIALALREYAKLDFGSNYLTTIELADKFQNAKSVSVTHQSSLD